MRQFTSEKDFADGCRRMMISVACKTATMLGYKWTAQVDGTVEVHSSDGNTYVASSWEEFSRWMREDWAARRSST